MSTIQEESYQFKNLVLSDKYLDEPSKLAAVIGVDDNGEPILFDFAKNPHLFIGGDQGCGKSTLIHSIIMSLMQRNTPNEFQFMYFDPKGLEANLYFRSQYLNFFVRKYEPIVAFEYLAKETNRRLLLLSNAHKRSLLDYNKLAETCVDVEKIPELFVLIDEISLIIDKGGITEKIESLFINARTVGIHFIISDTNPTLKNVLKIAQLFSCRVLFRFTYADYKALLNRTDIVPASDDGEILCDFGGDNFIHGHSCFVSMDDVSEAVLKKQENEETLNQKIQDYVKVLHDSYDEGLIEPTCNHEDDESDWDPLLCDAAVFAVKNRGLITSDLQKHLNIGYARASRIVDQLEEKGIVGCSQGAKPRECLINNIEELKEVFGDEYIETETLINEVTEVDADDSEYGFEEKSKIESVLQFISQNKNYIIYGVVAVIVMITIYFVFNLKAESFVLVAVAVLISALAIAAIKEMIKWHKYKPKRTKYNIYSIDNISDGHTFEYVVADLLKNAGFYNVKVTVGSGDFGIDVIGWYGDASYAIQCKKYSNKVGVSAVQEAYSGRSYYGCNYAVVITNNYFTPAAIKLAKSNGVILWDRTMIKKLINGHL